MTRKLYVLNGPNLNMLGQREPELYGSATLDDVRADCVRVADELGFDLFFAQSNAEHQIVDWLHDAYREKATVVINPAGFSFRSVPVLDALRMLDTAIVEIHITNIHARDAAHQNSLVSSVAQRRDRRRGRVRVRAGDSGRRPTDWRAYGGRQPRMIVSAASIPNTRALVSAVPVMYEAPWNPPTTSPAAYSPSMRVPSMRFTDVSGATLTRRRSRSSRSLRGTRKRAAR